MVIPLEGEEVPAELADVPIQGTLPKPFFLPELPERIRQALSRPLAAPAQAEAEKAPARAPAGEAVPGVLPLMSRLAQEVGAEAVLLIRGGELVAHTGRMSENGVAALTSLVPMPGGHPRTLPRFWAKNNSALSRALRAPNICSTPWPSPKTSSSRWWWRAKSPWG
ncbi:MAG: hypothetical protein D6793_04710, partial [Thermoflexia bacterium]